VRGAACCALHACAERLHSEPFPSFLGPDSNLPLRQVKKALGAAMDKFGRLDGVVNCTGDMTMKPAHLTGEDEFMDGLRINALSSFNVIAAAVRAARRPGRQACMRVAGPGRRGRCACAICCARAIRAAPRCVRASASCGARIGACHRSDTVMGAAAWPVCIWPRRDRAAVAVGRVK